jgi:TonB family protein
MRSHLAAIALVASTGIAIAAAQSRAAGQELEVVVQADGSVGDVRVIKSLDTQFGLDAEAVATAKRWQFKPGSYNGAAVPVIVTLILEFKLATEDLPKRVWTAAIELPGQSAPDDEFLKGAVFAKAPGVIPPKVKKQINPRYTSAAMRLKIQGHVVVDAVVLPDGTVGRSRIHTSLDKVYGLDDEALAAVNRWTFEPGTLNGKPVAVVVTLVMEFRLH